MCFALTGLEPMSLAIGNTTSFPELWEPKTKNISCAKTGSSIR